MNDDLLAKINKSTLISNAENRLISELSKFYILTNSFGWTLEYNGEQVKEDEFYKLLL